MNEKWKTVLKIAVGAGALYFSRCVYNAKKFSASCDINEDSLDHTLLFGSDDLDLGKGPMKDLKLGAYFGYLRADASRLEPKQRAYDFTVSVNNATLELIVPRESAVMITGSNIIGSVLDLVPQREEVPDTIIAIHADILFGTLVVSPG